MYQSLEDAIVRLVADAKANNQLLKVAPASTSLAREFGGDPRTIAQMIIEHGVHAHVSMDMKLPEETPAQGHQQAPTETSQHQHQD